MFSAIITLLGGSAFRMIWGEFSSWWTARQEQQHEMERMRLQGELDAAAHTRNIEALRVQAELGIKTIEATATAAVSQTDADAFADAVAAVGKPTGIKFVDTWNGIIRPWLATLATLMVMVQFIQHGFVMTDWDRELVGGILGIYIADRILVNRGK